MVIGDPKSVIFKGILVVGDPKPVILKGFLGFFIFILLERGIFINTDGDLHFDFLSEGRGFFILI